MAGKLALAGVGSEGRALARVLLFGHDRDLVRGVHALLRDDGHEVRRIARAAVAPEEERDAGPEVVVCAGDPGGLPRAAAAIGFAAPLLCVHAPDRPGAGEREDRLVDRLASPFMREEFLARVDALVRVRRIVLRHGGSDGPSAARGAGRSLGGRVARFFGRRRSPVSRPAGPYLEVSAQVARWAEGRDGIELGHADRVATYCGMMAGALHLSEAESALLIRAALLHDIGKVALPTGLLTRPGPLTDEQMRLLRTHPERGARLLRALEDASDVTRTVLYHHERADGSGYYGKTGDQTPPTSRVLAVAETFDAMTRSRVRDTVSVEDALDRLEDGRGERYDADCVDALRAALRPRRPSVPVSSIYS